MNKKGLQAQGTPCAKREREREEAEALAELLEILAEVWDNHLPILYARLKDNWGRFRGSGAAGILSAARGRLLERRPVLRFDSVGAAIDYLMRAVDSEVIDRARNSKRFEAHDEQGFDALLSYLRKVPSPEELAIRGDELRERKRFLRDCKAAVGELTPKLREVVELRWFSAVRPSFREIGEQLNISAEAARKRHERALLKLRGLLGLVE